MTKAPYIQKDIKRGYGWRHCPWSMSDKSGRIPIGERTVHPVTSGNMELDVRGGHDNVGFVCLDPTCPYYLGTATTILNMKVKNQCLNRQTGEYTIETVSIPIPICSGIPFWEK